jgi:hypothetical protein
MKRLALLLLLALPLFAQTKREIFPSDYTPLPCAAKNVCNSQARVDFARYAVVHRALPVRQEWVDKHWDELNAVFAPICTKIANCMAIPANVDWYFCTDFMRADFLATADRYQQGTDDHDQWLMAALVWYFGLDQAAMAGHKEAQACANAQPPGPDRALTLAINPTKIGPGYTGNLVVYALDAETHIPVMAWIEVEGQQLAPATDSPRGHAMSFYKIPWPVAFNSATNASGHRDLVAPNVIVKAPGYQTATMRIPIDIPTVNVEMQPPVSELHRGPNAVTIVAKDAATGQPVEMRVMAGTQILGNTNKPLVLEIAKGQKRPEIWVTSLFNRYGDVVVAKAD